MQINLITIGKNMPSWIEAGYQEYNKRLPKDYQIKLTEINLPKRSKTADIKTIIKKEAELLQAVIPKNSYIITLDEHGELWDTQQLATQLQHWRSQQQITLIVGGPDGLAPELLQQAKKKWSLSPLTLPHPLVRVIVAEQLYRAWTILNHHPYHRGN